MRSLARVPLISACALALMCALAACDIAAQPGTHATSSVSASDVTSDVATDQVRAESSTPAPQAPAEVAPVSQPMLAYAAGIGGTPHPDAQIYLLIGDTFDSEKAAQASLGRARPLFGDMQSYFIVQRSDNFGGLPEGRWIVAEAHKSRPTEEDMQFAQRAYKHAYAKPVVVHTTDPIPVAEELGAEAK